MRGRTPRHHYQWPEPLSIRHQDKEGHANLIAHFRMNRGPVRPARPMADLQFRRVTTRSAVRPPSRRASRPLPPGRPTPSRRPAGRSDRGPGSETATLPKGCRGSGSPGGRNNGPPDHGGAGRIEFRSGRLRSLRRRVTGVLPVESDLGLGNVGRVFVRRRCLGEPLGRPQSGPDQQEAENPHETSIRVGHILERCGAR
jgi:hypothetical protein